MLDIRRLEFGGAVTLLVAFKSWDLCPGLVMFTLGDNPVIRRAACSIVSGIADVVAAELVTLVGLTVLVDVPRRTRRFRRWDRVRAVVVPILRVVAVEIPKAGVGIVTLVVSAAGGVGMDAIGGLIPVGDGATCGAGIVCVEIPVVGIVAIKELENNLEFVGRSCGVIPFVVVITPVPFANLENDRFNA